ncbi:TSUP family transporter [Streptomyces sp. NPDC055051]
MEWTLVAGVTAGLLISVVTAPVGVSGAVFLLPVHLSVFGVPNPSITPTNLLFNVVAGPGALWRYRRDGALRGPLARRLVAGTLPGVVVGAVIRVYALPGPTVYRLLIAGLLLPLGVWLCARTLLPARRPGPAASPATEPSPAGKPSPATQPSPAREPSPAGLTALALAVGVVGGIYGIGGGSLVGPVLVARGLPVARVAPAALATTFVTSVVGAATYAVLSLLGTGDIAPDWWLGLACGLGGLVGGYLGARLQPRLPERALRLLLGTLATTIGALYAAQALT